jgi:hypothetical protein
MSPASFYDPCIVVITRKNTRNLFPYTDPQVSGHIIYMDLPPTFAYQVITSSTTFQCYLIMVNTTSRNHQTVGLNYYISDSVITTVSECTALHKTQLLLNTSTSEISRLTTTTTKTKKTTTTTITIVAIQ